MYTSPCCSQNFFARIRPILPTMAVTLVVSAIFLAFAHDCSLPLEITLFTEASIIIVALIKVTQPQKQRAQSKKVPAKHLPKRRLPTVTPENSTQQARQISSIATSTLKTPRADAFSLIEGPEIYQMVFTSPYIDLNDFLSMVTVHRLGYQLLSESSGYSYFVSSSPHLSEQMFLRNRQRLEFSGAWTTAFTETVPAKIAFRYTRFHDGPSLPPFSSMKFHGCEMNEAGFRRINENSALTHLDLTIHSAKDLHSWTVLFQNRFIKTLQLRATEATKRFTNTQRRISLPSTLTELHLDTDSINYQKLHPHPPLTKLVLNGDMTWPMVITDELCPKFHNLQQLVLSQGFYNQQFFLDLQRFPLQYLTVGTTFNLDNIATLLAHPTLSSITLTLHLPSDAIPEDLNPDGSSPDDQAIIRLRDEKIKSISIMWGGKSSYSLTEPPYRPESQGIFEQLMTLREKITSISSTRSEIFSSRIPHSTAITQFTYDYNYRSLKLCPSSLLNHFPSLTHLTLKGRLEFSQPLCTTRLRSLSLEFTSPTIFDPDFASHHPFPMSFLNELLARTPSLSSLSLKTFTLVTEDLSDLFTKKQSLRLRVLKLEGIRVHSSLLQTLAQSQRSLNYLSIHYPAWKVSTEEVSALRQIPCLRGLSISDLDTTHIAPFWNDEEPDLSE